MRLSLAVGMHEQSHVCMMNKHTTSAYTPIGCKTGCANIVVSWRTFTIKWLHMKKSLATL
jgi:hypothetical protein